MISTVVLVHAEFDIARGCKTLRAHVAAQNWQPSVGARATAAFTALGDLVLNSSSDELVPINLTIINAGKQTRIELACNFYMSDPTAAVAQEAAERLRRASDDLDFYETSGNVQITARLYVNGKVSR
jgi:hypothetical protein